MKRESFNRMSPTPGLRVPAAGAAAVLLAALIVALGTAYWLDTLSFRRLAAACVVGGGAVFALAACLLMVRKRKHAALTALFVAVIRIAGVTAVTDSHTSSGGKAVNPILALCTIALLGFVCFLGVLSSLYNVGARSWLSAAVDKATVVIGLNELQDFKSDFSISTSRYEFGAIAKWPGAGEWQITTTDSKDVLAIERHTGLLVLFSPNHDSYTETVLSESVFPENTTLGYPGNVAPLAMDLHFGLGRLLYSLVVETNSCQTLILFEVNLSNSLEEVGSPIERFRTPCVIDSSPGMWAGRITSNSSEIFMSVGEQRYTRSGYPKIKIFSKDDLALDKTVFGKILSFNASDYDYTIYSSGHRNAQGLFWDAERNQLLSAEHGPDGGDEVNLIIEGYGYGWPAATFGKPYATRYPSGDAEVNDGKNPGDGVDLLPERESLRSGTHRDFAGPLMSWIPGVGIGNLVRVANDSSLRDWRGDILAATMGEQKLHRLKMTGGAVVLDESINIGRRIRDLLVLENGDIALSLDGTLCPSTTTGALAYSPSPCRVRERNGEVLIMAIGGTVKLRLLVAE